MPMVKLPLKIEHALLGFLRRQPMYGYEIYQRMVASSELGLVWNIKQSMLYAVLARLENEGYLRSTIETQESRPPRKILSLTPRGEEAFVRWVATPVKHSRDFRIEFLAKLYFALQDGAEPALALVKRQRKATQATVEAMQRQADDMLHRSYDWLVLRFRIGQTAALLDWLDLCEHWIADPASHPPHNLILPDDLPGQE